MFLDKLFAGIKSLFAPKVTITTTTAQPVASDNTAGVTASAITTTTTVTPAEVVDADLTAAITIVNNIRAALASPLAVLITDLIPGTLDDTIREQLVNDLPIITADLGRVKLAVTADKSAQLNNVLAELKGESGTFLDAFFHSLASTILTRISAGKGVTWSIAVMSVEYFFKNLFSSGPVAETVAPVVNTVSTVVNTASDVAGAAGAIAAAAGASPTVQKDIATAGNILNEIESAVNQ